MITLYVPKLEPKEPNGLVKLVFFFATLTCHVPSLKEPKNYLFIYFYVFSLIRLGHVQLDAFRLISVQFDSVFDPLRSIQFGLGQA